MSTQDVTAGINIGLTDTDRWALEDLLQAISVQIQLTPDQDRVVTKLRKCLDLAAINIPMEAHQ